MPIEHNKSGSTTLTGDSIDFFRLAMLKSAVGLELKGIRVTRGPVVWKRVKNEFNLKAKTKKEVYQWLCAEVERLKALQEHVVHEDGRVKREVGGKEIQ